MFRAVYGSDCHTSVAGRLRVVQAGPEAGSGSAAFAMRSGNGCSSVPCTLRPLSLQLLTERVGMILLAPTGAGKRRERLGVTVLLLVISKEEAGTQQIWGRQTML